MIRQTLYISPNMFYNTFRYEYSNVSEFEESSIRVFDLTGRNYNVTSKKLNTSTNKIEVTFEHENVDKIYGFVEIKAKGEEKPCHPYPFLKERGVDNYPFNWTHTSVYNSFQSDLLAGKLNLTDDQVRIAKENICRPIILQSIYYTESDREKFPPELYLLSLVDNPSVTFPVKAHRKIFQDRMFYTEINVGYIPPDSLVKVTKQTLDGRENKKYYMYTTPFTWEYFDTENKLREYIKNLPTPHIFLAPYRDGVTKENIIQEQVLFNSIEGLDYLNEAGTKYLDEGIEVFNHNIKKDSTNLSPFILKQPYRDNGVEKVAYSFWEQNSRKQWVELFIDNELLDRLKAEKERRIQAHKAVTVLNQWIAYVEEKIQAREQEEGDTYTTYTKPIPDNIPASEIQSVSIYNVSTGKSALKPGTEIEIKGSNLKFTLSDKQLMSKPHFWLEVIKNDGTKGFDVYRGVWSAIPDDTQRALLYSRTEEISLLNEFKTLYEKAHSNKRLEQIKGWVDTFTKFLRKNIQEPFKEVHFSLPTDSLKQRGSKVEAYTTFKCIDQKDYSRFDIYNDKNQLIGTYASTYTIPNGYSLGYSARFLTVEVTSYGGTEKSYHFYKWIDAPSLWSERYDLAQIYTQIKGWYSTEVLEDVKAKYKGAMDWLQNELIKKANLVFNMSSALAVDTGLDDTIEELHLEGNLSLTGTVRLKIKDKKTDTLLGEIDSVNGVIKGVINLPPNTKKVAKLKVVIPLFDVEIEKEFRVGINQSMTPLDVLSFVYPNDDQTKTPSSIRLRMTTEANSTLFLASESDDVVYQGTTDNGSVDVTFDIPSSIDVTQDVNTEMFLTVTNSEEVESFYTINLKRTIPVVEEKEEEERVEEVVEEEEETNPPVFRDISIIPGESSTGFTTYTIRFYFNKTNTTIKVKTLDDLSLSEAQLFGSNDDDDFRANELPIMVSDTDFFEDSLKLWTTYKGKEYTQVFPFNREAPRVPNEPSNEPSTETVETEKPKENKEKKEVSKPIKYMTYSVKGDIDLNRSSGNYENERRQFLDTKYKNMVLDVNKRNSKKGSKYEYRGTYFDSYTGVISFCRIVGNYEESKWRDYVIEFDLRKTTTTSSGQIDLSNYLTRDVLSTLATKDDLDNLRRTLTEAINAIQPSTVDTSSLENAIQELTNKFSNYYTKQEVDTLISNMNEPSKFNIVNIVNPENNRVDLGTYFDNRTIVRIASENPTQLYLPTDLDDSKIGHTLIVRSLNNGIEFNDENDALFPKDALWFRREGSTITVVYVGNGKYDLFGEL